MALTLIACDAPAPPAPVEIPDSPPEAFETILNALESNQPRILWDALPPSYQEDLKELRTVFCTNMDAELYDKTFEILGNIAKALDQQEDYIFNSPMALNTPLIESSIGNHWNEVVNLLELIVTSDISTIESLQEVDPARFLDSTGQEFYEDLQNLTRKLLGPGKMGPWGFLNQVIDEAQIEFIPSTNSSGVIKFTKSDGSVEEIKLTEVEGRWIPSGLADSWDQTVLDTRAGMERLNSPQFQQIKPIVSLVWSTVDHTIKRLLKADSQKEFDQVLSSLTSVGDMFGSMANPFQLSNPENEAPATE